MTGILSSFYRAVTSCWNPPAAKDEAELDLTSPGRPCADGSLTTIIADGKWCSSGAKVEPVDFREDVAAGATDPGTVTDGCMYKSLEEFVQHHTVRAARPSVPPVDTTIQVATNGTPPIESVETVKERVAEHREKIFAVLEDAAIFWRNRQDRPKDFLRTAMWNRTDALVNLLPHTEAHRENQKALLDDKYENIPLLLAYHDRQVEQDEIEVSLRYGKKILDAHVQAYGNVLPLHWRGIAAEADRKLEFRKFLETARQAGVPTLAILHWPGHWLAFVADLCGTKPVFYICDTSASVDDVKRKRALENYLRALAYLSDKEINPGNTVYCGYAMQRFTPNACGVLACWMLEQLAAKIKNHPELPIDALFDACANDWWPTGASEEDHKRFVLLFRAEMLARLHA